MLLKIQNCEDGEASLYFSLEAITQYSITDIQISVQSYSQLLLHNHHESHFMNAMQLI